MIEELLRRQAVATRRADDLTMVGVTGGDGGNVGEPPPANCWRTEVEVTAAANRGRARRAAHDLTLAGCSRRQRARRAGSSRCGRRSLWKLTHGFGRGPRVIRRGGRRCLRPVERLLWLRRVRVGVENVCDFIRA